MPIVIVLLLLWLGTFLDMASTYLMVVILDDEFIEINQNFVNANGDILLVNFLVINGVFLLVFSLLTIFTLKNRNMIKKYIMETGLSAHFKYMGTLKKDLRKEDFVTIKLIKSVSNLIIVGSVGGARCLFFVNNLTEFLGYPGFMVLFLWAFPAVHNQLALHIVFAIAVFVLYPFTYLLLRLTTK